MLFETMYSVELLLLNVAAIKIKMYTCGDGWIIIGKYIYIIYFIIYYLFFNFAGRLRRTGHFARTYTGGWVVHKKAK